MNKHSFITHVTASLLGLVVALIAGMDGSFAPIITFVIGAILGYKICGMYNHSDRPK